MFVNPNLQTPDAKSELSEGSELRHQRLPTFKPRAFNSHRDLVRSLKAGKSPSHHHHQQHKHQQYQQQFRSPPNNGSSEPSYRNGNQISSSVRTPGSNRVSIRTIHTDDAEMNYGRGLEKVPPPRNLFFKHEDEESNLNSSPNCNRPSYGRAISDSSLKPPWFLSCRFYFILLVVSMILAILTAVLVEMDLRGGLTKGYSSGYNNVGGSNNLGDITTFEEEEEEEEQNNEQNNEQDIYVVTDNDDESSDNVDENGIVESDKDKDNSLPTLPERWEQLGQDLTGPFSNSWFGYAISMSNDGTVVAIGVPLHPNLSRGMVQVFTQVAVDENHSGSTLWKQLGNDISASPKEGTNFTYDGVDGDRFGWSLSLSSDGLWLAVGSKLHMTDDESIMDNGNVKLYNYDADTDTWIQKGSDIIGIDSGDVSGYAVSISKEGQYIAIGAPGNNDGGSSAGMVHVYENNLVERKTNNNKNSTSDVEHYSEEWDQIGSNLLGVGDLAHFGRSCSISDDGTRIAIGSVGHSDSEAGRIGGVFIYELTKKENVGIANEVVQSWELLGDPIYGEGDGDEAGFSVSLSSDGNRVAIGAIKNDGDVYDIIDPGHVRIFQYDNSSSKWLQLGGDLDGQESQENFGFSLKLSSDGNRVAIGSVHQSKGEVNVYEYSDALSVWIQIGEAIEGDSEEDYSGYAVGFSGDGSIVAIGAPMGGKDGDRSGAVKIYRLIKF